MGIFDGLLAEIGAAPLARRFGHVAEVGRGAVMVQGLAHVAALGDRVAFAGRETDAGGEVVALSRGSVTVLPDGGAEGIAVGDAVEHIGPALIAPDDAFIGRVIDPFGRPLDGRPLFRGAHPRPLRTPAPPAARRRRLGARLETGLCAFNTVLPIVAGQRVGLFAGSGVG